jgi:5S rRNA maturation endonuclease (ribonuclease M5)
LVSQDNRELLVKQIKETRELNLEIPIIVEGRLDVLALRKIGFSGEIIHLPKNKTIINFSYSLTKYREVILLMDWDRKGKRLTSILEKYLITEGIRVNLKLWKLLNTINSETSNVEGLPAFMEKIGYL